ncbi:hypothetical protein ACTG23_01575 [Aeromonas enteropelogenes]|uniref:hypothetical protein n=1 Tax=Aeromonas enteropelogenes TaxID=29489 RepID=UPI003F7926DB
MKKEILALLVVVACSGSTLQANDWKNAPISEVQKAAEQSDARGFEKPPSRVLQRPSSFSG